MAYWLEHCFIHIAVVLGFTVKLISFSRSNESHITFILIGRPLVVGINEVASVVCCALVPSVTAYYLGRYLAYSSRLRV